MTIVLKRDPATGKQNITVKLDSDADALPHEHEQLHRQLVEKLVGNGIPLEDLGEIHIERESTPAIGAGAGSPEGEREKTGAGAGR
jgi:hypothetical protein